MPITSGILTAPTLGPGTVALVLSAASTGGTAPYTYQLQRAPDLNGVAQAYSNIGAPQAGLAFADSGLALNTRYHYRVVMTDAVMATATSNAVAVTTGQSPPNRVMVAERIAINLLATLGTITKAAGYSVDARPVRPNPGIPASLQDGLMVLISNEPALEEDRPLQYTQWLHEFLIGCEVVESETSPVSVDTRRNQVRADVEFALTYDASLTSRPNQTRGFLAEDTLVGEPQMIPLPANAHEGQIVVVVRVRYRTLYNDPFTSVYD